jgi:hypothetical protein
MKVVKLSALDSDIIANELDEYKRLFSCYVVVVLLLLLFMVTIYLIYDIKTSVTKINNSLNLFQKTGLNAHKEIYELTNQLSGLCTCAAKGFGDVPDLVSLVTGDLGANKLNAEEDVSLVFREWYTIAPLRATTYT